MQDSTTKTAAGGRLPTFGPDTIETLMRARVRTTIEAIVQEELDAALGAEKSARVGETRQGYRHGSRERTRTTSLGPATIQLPRARIQAADGTTAEWRSATVTRYQRRTVRVDEMILGVYLAGTNTRRIKGALAPLLRNGPLSKDAVLRLVGRLREDFDTWRSRDLADEDIRYVFMDGWYPKVRIGGRRARVPVLVTLGVRANGQRVVFDLRLAGEERAASGGEVVASLVARHLPRPVLAMIDGNPGLATALLAHWPGLAIQRCTAHKLRNLQSKAPARLREELTEDYRRMILRRNGDGRRASTGPLHQEVAAAVSGSRGKPGRGRRRAIHVPPAFPARSGRHCAPPTRSSGFTRNFVGARRPRPVCQDRDAVLLLLFGLLRSGQVKLRALVGYQDMEGMKQAA